jgi:hypothetical protein
MKKILISLLILALVVVLILFFWGGGRASVSNFFNEGADFGSFFDTDPQSQNDIISVPPTSTSTTPTSGPYVAPVLRQISFEPVSGYTFYSTTSTSTRVFSDPERGEVTQEFTSTSTVVRFQERATGHTYDVFAFLENLVKVSNITVQKIYSSIFTNDPNTALTISPSLDNESIRTSLIRIIPAQEETKTASSTLQRIEQVDISTAMNNLLFIPETSKIAYAISSFTGSNILTADTKKTSEKMVVSVPFSDFTLDYINGSKVLLQTKASSAAKGYAYSLDLADGSLTKIIGDVQGLLIKPSYDLKYYLYSESTLNRPIIRAYDSVTGTTRQIGLQTIPEKCMFSKRTSSEAYCFGSVSYSPATYPDDWYMGKVFNEEHLYKIDLTTGSVVNVYLFEKGQVFDVINPKISPNEELIAFQNKYDLTLWTLDLKALDNEF